jgi:hypothetical protein
MRFAAERVRSSVLFCHGIRAPGDNPPATVLFRMSLNGCTCGTQARLWRLRRNRAEVHELVVCALKPRSRLPTAPMRAMLPTAVMVAPVLTAIRGSSAIPMAIPAPASVAVAIDAGLTEGHSGKS